MDKNRLSESLEELQEALRKTTAISKQDRQRLELLEANIQKKLERDEDIDDEDDNIVEELVDELGDEIREFEVSHPQITLALGHLLDILSQSGV
jgi:CII-binding regulator of phage lambda lysogenization HflD